MIGKRILRFDTLDSTNDYIKQHLNILNHGTIIVASEQTKGRGRFGNTWESAPGNLYLSVLLKNMEFSSNLFDLHIKVSIVIISILNTFNIKANIKYPNDIIVDGKKIAGILVETIGYDKSKNVILGVGLNVNQREFKNLDNKAVSIINKINYRVEVETIIENFVDTFNRKIDMNKLYLGYLEKSLIIGKRIEYMDDNFVVETIRRDGRIVLKNKSKKIDIEFDKLSFSSIYN